MRKPLGVLGAVLAGAFWAMGMVTSHYEKWQLAAVFGLFVAGGALAFKARGRSHALVAGGVAALFLALAKVVGWQMILNEAGDPNASIWEAMTDGPGLPGESGARFLFDVFTLIVAFATPLFRSATSPAAKKARSSCKSSLPGRRSAEPSGWRLSASRPGRHAGLGSGYAPAPIKRLAFPAATQGRDTCCLAGR